MPGNGDARRPVPVGVPGVHDRASGSAGDSVDRVTESVEGSGIARNGGARELDDRGIGRSVKIHRDRARTGKGIDVLAGEPTRLIACEHDLEVSLRVRRRLGCVLCDQRHKPAVGAVA